MKISRADALEYFSIAPKILGPDIPDGLVFCYASGPVCGVFNWLPWPGVLMGHIGAKREALGHADPYALSILHEAWDYHRPERIAGWIKEKNRAVRAMCLRLGMEQDGRMDLPDPVLMFGWRP